MNVTNMIILAKDLAVTRAGASYFRLAGMAMQCEEARGGLGACSPMKIFKIRHSEIASEAMFGPKYY